MRSYAHTSSPPTFAKNFGRNNKSKRYKCLAAFTIAGGGMNRKLG